MSEKLYKTYYQSPIGVLLIEATDQYISQVTFEVETITNIVNSSTNPLLTTCVDQLIEYFNGVRLVFTLPIMQNGTVFQMRVWNELININFGKTISYLTLARRLGDANCIRAAAASNGKNHIAIIVPCHRVIGSNQSLVGYAGGLWRKKWLLDHENKIAHGVQTLF